MFDLYSLERLCMTHGTAGDESEIRELLKTEAEPYADDITVDPMGNLIVHVKGDGPKVMLTAHMDVCGFMVTHFEKEGVMRFAPVGGLDPATILQAPVRFKNGVKGLISCDDNKLGKELKMSDLFIDIGAKNAKDAKSMVRIGDSATYFAELYLNRHCIMGPYLDDRAGCFLLLEVMKGLESRKNDLYFVFTAQEEIGARGAGTAAFAIEPDYAIAVDVTCPDDIPGALHEGTTSVGKGAAVKIMDHSFFAAPQVVSKLDELAKKNKIRTQNDIMTCGGTDAGNVYRTRGGILTGGISIPCRYTHAPTELMDLNDFEECVRLVSVFCESEL